MIPYGPIYEFHLGPITLSAWGTMVAIGFLVGILLFWHFGEKKFKLSEKNLTDIGMLIFIGSILGARILYVIEYWNDYSGNLWAIFKIWEGGMVYYGGLILALILVLGYVRWKKLDFWKIADAAALALPAGVAIGRIGCHLIRDHPGSLTSVPWAINYYGVLRHETAQYEIIASLIIGVLLWFWVSRKKLFSGALFLFYVGAYAIARFITEFYRATDLPQVDLRWGALTVSQYISIMIVVGVVFFWYHKSHVHEEK